MRATTEPLHGHVQLRSQRVWQLGNIVRSSVQAFQSLLQRHHFAVGSVATVGNEVQCVANVGPRLDFVDGPVRNFRTLLYNGQWCPHHRGAPAVENELFPGGGQSAEGTLTVRKPILRTWKHSSAQVYPTVNGQPRIRAACTVASRRFLGQSPVGILPHQRKSSRLRGKGSRPFRGQGWFQRTIATRHVLLLPFIPPDCEIWQQVTLGKATAHGLLPKVELKGSQGALKQI